ncbi:MAG TPA: hypothetical protein VGZ26_07745, partial [Pirellulales bacterium]|nr:hypothetical protein [Pirellulales bacterium]
ACRTLGLAVVEFPARELSDLAAHRVGIAATTMAALVADMKRCVGAPWGHDQKQSMTAAWAVLAPDVKAKPSSPPPRRQK